MCVDTQRPSHPQAGPAPQKRHTCSYNAFTSIMRPFPGATPAVSCPCAGGFESVVGPQAGWSGGSHGADRLFESGAPFESRVLRFDCQAF